MPNDSSLARDYLVTPELGRGPGVLILHSGRGYTSFIEQFCHRLSMEGFVALAPDLFDGKTATSVEESRVLKAEVDVDQTGRRLEDVGEFLRQHETVSRRAIGVIGFGYGAEWACRLGSRFGDECGAIVLFYGWEDADWNSVHAPILGHYAQLDQALPPSRVNDLRDEFKTYDVAHDLFIYQNVEPSFFETDATARHNADAAQLAWERTVEFLRRQLQGH